MAIGRKTMNMVNKLMGDITEYSHMACVGQSGRSVLNQLGFEKRRSFLITLIPFSDLVDLPGC